MAHKLQRAIRCPRAHECTHYTQRATFQLTDAASVRRLAFTCHRCGFRDGLNTLEFRRNLTDGISLGYRVLSFNLVRATGVNALSSSTFAEEDPARWTVQGTAADIMRGKTLWETAPLITSPLSAVPLQSKCASCHAHDGRDLKYFNYSDWSIVTRSQFHGLSEADGRAIAAYVRSRPVRYAAKARPWNPPYQPGPGLDARPVSDWSAGAGFDAVLDRDADMIAALFPRGTGPAEIAQVVDIRGTLNLRELPIPLQLPDWNEWLPDVHPVDLWSTTFTSSDAARSYADIRAAFVNGGAARLVANRTIVREFSYFIRRIWWVGFRNMYGAVPCQSYASQRAMGPTGFLLDSLPTGKTCEDGASALSKWLAVKNWELFQEFELEEVTPQLLPFGERRSWFGSVVDATERNVFEVAPHRSADNSHNFKYQTRAQGSYASAAWYQLQLTLNAGNRDPWTWFPQDWFYTPAFISIGGRENNTPLPALLTAMQIKMYQNLDMRGPTGMGVDRGPDYNGWWLPFVTPWRFESIPGWEPNQKGYPWRHLDGYQPGLRVKITNAFLFEFLRKIKTYPVDRLPRQMSVTAQGLDKFEHRDYVFDTSLPPDTAACYYSCPGEGHAARDLYRAGMRFKEMGVDPMLRNEYAEWLKAVYPNPRNPWDNLK